MIADVLLRVLYAVGLIAVVLFMPRWMSWLSLRKAYSAHDVLQGEHGLDRFSYVVILLIVYGFLIYFAIALEPLFAHNASYFWCGIIGILLIFPAVRFYPRKRPPNEWHDQ